MPVFHHGAPEGFATTIALAVAPGLLLWEKELTPPELSGGEPINTTSMRQEGVYETFSPTALAKVGDIEIVCGWSLTFTMIQINNILNINTLITITLPDLSTITLWGWLGKFKPNAHKPGSQPTANVTLHVSNVDDTDPNNTVYTEPVYAPPP